MKTVEELIQELRNNGFHGSITIHFANGTPKKVELKTVGDVE